MPLRASLGNALSLAARAARVGGACLGLAVLLFSRDPAAILGLLAVGALAVGGGVVWTAGAQPAGWVRLLLLVPALVAARLAAGSAAAVLGAVLLTLGVLLRIRTEEVILGLAVFGGIVAALGGARGWLLLVFWVLGIALAALRRVAAAAWRGRRRLAARNSERTRAITLNPGSDVRRGLSLGRPCDREDPGQDLASLRRGGAP